MAVAQFFMTNAKLVRFGAQFAHLKQGDDYRVAPFSA